MARKVAAKRARVAGRRTTLRHGVVAAALGAVALAAYANSFSAGFVLDNQEMLRQARLYHTQNTSVSEILSHDYWWPNWISGAYRPLSTLSYSLNYSVFGNEEHPAGYHLVNLLLHWGNAVLVYFLVLALVEGVPRGGAESRRWVAMFAALLFTSHPIATEAVTNIVGRSDLLATAAVLGGLLLYIRSHRGTGRERLPWLLAFALTSAAGCFSKESGLVICGVIVLYDFTFRLDRGDGDATVAGRLVSVARDWLVLIPPLLLFWGARAWVYRAVAPVPVYFSENHLVATDFLTARLTAIKVLGKSLWLLVWPSRLCWDYSVDAIPIFQWTLRSWEDWQAFVALSALAGIAAVCVRLFRTNKPLFFFIGFGFGAILPTSNLILLIPSVMAERFLYMPLVGFTACAALAAQAVHNRLDKVRRNGESRDWLRPAIWCVLGIVVVAYGVRTTFRNFDWRDELSIRTRGVEVNPASFRVHYALARTLFETDAANLDRAIGEAERAQAILERTAPPSVPIPAYVLQDLGVYYEEKARRATRSDGVGSPDALSWRRKAADVMERATAWYRLANEEHRQIEIARGRRPEEILDVGVASVYAQLGDIYLRLDQPHDAITALVQARHLAPRDADIHEELSRAYAAAGRNEDAILSLLQAYMFDQARPSIWSQLAPLYEAIDPGGCAFTRVGEELRFDDTCPITRRHICQAFQRQVEVYREGHLWAEAEELRQSGQRGYACEF